MAGMHALHKILAKCARPPRTRVEPGEFLEVEPDVFGVIVGVNGTEAKRMAADLAELGVTELPLKNRIYAVADHASPAPTVAIAQSQKLWRDFFRDHGIRTRRRRRARKSRRVSAASFEAVRSAGSDRGRARVRQPLSLLPGRLQLPARSRVSEGTEPRAGRAREAVFQ